MVGENHLENEWEAEKVHVKYNSGHNKHEQNGLLSRSPIYLNAFLETRSQQIKHAFQSQGLESTSIKVNKELREGRFCVV